MKNEMDLLIDSLIQKQNSILNKVQIVDEKAAIYNLSDKGKVINDLLIGLDEFEEQLDDSIESFSKTEEAISAMWDSIKESIHMSFPEETKANENYRKIPPSGKDKLIEELNLEVIGKTISNGDYKVRKISKETHIYSEKIEALLLMENGYTVTVEKFEETTGGIK